MWEEIGDSVGVNKVATGIAYPQRIQIRGRSGNQAVAISVFDYGLEGDAGIGGQVALFEQSQREGVLSGGGAQGDAAAAEVEDLVAGDQFEQALADAADAVYNQFDGVAGLDEAIEQDADGAVFSNRVAGCTGGVGEGNFGLRVEDDAVACGGCRNIGNAA